LRNGAISGIAESIEYFREVFKVCH